MKQYKYFINFTFGSNNERSLCTHLSTDGYLGKPDLITLVSERFGHDECTVEITNANVSDWCYKKKKA